MYNRAQIVDHNFVSFVKSGQLPKARTHLKTSDFSLSPHVWVDLFESQVISRHLDLRARELKDKGQCFYTIGSSGHEGNAVMAKVFRKTDMAFLHYRSGAFYIQRAKQQMGSTPLYDMLLSFVASSDDPISGGRHKVIGSKELFIPPQTSTIASHLPKAVGAAMSIPKSRDLQLSTPMPPDSVVLCSFGDASSNHSTALGAFNTATLISYQNMRLPLVFICEDNRIGISVPTAQDWVKRNFSGRPQWHYLHADGLSLLDLYQKSLEAEHLAREKRRPVFLHMDTVRLLGHAGSDIESSYNNIKDIETNEFNDPLLHSARILIENHILSSEEVLHVYESIRKRVYHVSLEAVERPKLTTQEQVLKSLTACSDIKVSPPPSSEESRKEKFQRDFQNFSKPMHMAKLINWALTDIMLQYPNTLVFGEDVAKKGGVYHVTDGLFDKFKASRVFNSPLDEQSILGGAIGFSQNGFLPIPEIQFLAYVHNAEDQIRGEAATQAFFSQGQFTNPMVIRIAGLAYQKGFGGHFHNDNSLAIFRDIPGLIVAIPSNGADAVKMLRTCVREAYERGRVCVFIEPIALYMTKDLHTDGDKLWSFPYPSLEEEIPLGDFAVHGDESENVILTYGNGTYYSLQAQKVLQDHQKSVQVVDLRWMAPLDEKKLLQWLSSKKKVVLVEECRKTGSWSEGLVTLMVEHLKPLPEIQVLAAADSFIPLGVAATAGLPNKEKILSVCQEFF